MVPEGWHMEMLKNIVDGGIKNGYSPNAAEKNTGHWILGLGALGDNGLIASEIKPVEATQKVLNCRLHSGDFLISRSNTPDKVGRSILFKGEIDNCSYPDLIMRFRANESLVDTGFIEAKLKSFLVRGYFKNCAAGSSRTMVKINKPIVEKTPLLLPPLHEQKKIACILSTWDKAIDTVKNLIENSKAQKKALMQQLLTGKRRLPRFNGRWKEVCLADICSINPKRLPYAPDTKVSFIPMDAVSEDAKLIRYDIREYSKVKQGFTSFINGDVLIAKITPCFENGKGAYVENLMNGIGFGSTEFHVLRAKTEINSKFIYYLTNTREFRVRGETNMQGSAGQKRVTTNLLRSFKVAISSDYKEQQQISSVLTASDKEIEILQQKLDCLKQEKKALMQQLLTGKRRVKANVDG